MTSRPKDREGGSVVGDGISHCQTDGHWMLKKREKKKEEREREGNGGRERRREGKGSLTKWCCYGNLAFYQLLHTPPGVHTVLVKNHNPLAPGLSVGNLSK